MRYKGIKWRYVVKWYDKGARSFETYDHKEFEHMTKVLELKHITDYSYEMLKKYIEEV